MQGVVNSFLGKTTTLPVAVTVRFRNERKKIYVSFGELRIPKHAKIDEAEMEKLEEKYSCRIAETGNMWVVVPQGVLKIIREEGMLCSEIDEHTKILRGWFEKHGVKLIKEFFERGLF